MLDASASEHVAADLESTPDLKGPAYTVAERGSYLTAEPAWTGGAVRVHGATRS